MIFTKGAHQKAKFQASDCSGEISPNLYFDRLFLLKVKKFQWKKYGGVLSHDTEEWNKIWRKTDLLFQKWQDFVEFWSEHSNVSKMCTLIALFGAKNIRFDLKKYRGVIFYDTEESWKFEELSFMRLKSHAKFEEKLTCGLENGMSNLANFH